MRKLHYLLALALSAGAAAAAASGCELIASVDRAQIPTETGTGQGGGGTGGSGGSTTSGGGMGGMGGQGGFGGTMLANGDPCADGSQCTSTFCIDGVCCDTACDATCQACNVTGMVGTCTNAEAGTDPHDSCTDEGTTSCGMDGNCDGNGACSTYAAGTTCDPMSCANAMLSAADTCDASGACVDNGTQPCPNGYQCNVTGLSCLTACADSTECVDTHFCNMQSACVPDKPNSQTCMGNDQCQSGFCVDGRCCNTACGSSCQACDIAGSLGTCTPAPAGSTELGCMGNNACNGTGSCAAVNGQTCAGDGDCVSGHCVDGVCCNTACTAGCQACNNAGTEGTCGALPQGTVDPGCMDPNNTTCNASGQCKLAAGAPCSAPSDCASGSCAGSPISTCQP